MAFGMTQRHRSRARCSGVFPVKNLSSIAAALSLHLRASRWWFFFACHSASRCHAFTDSMRVEFHGLGSGSRFGVTFGPVIGLSWLFGTSPYLPSCD